MHITTHPLCGCKGTPVVIKRRFGRYRYFVRCSQCFTQTDRARTPEDAIASWRLAMSKED